MPPETEDKALNMEFEALKLREFEEEYPELSAEFKRIQAEQYQTFGLKMLSYGLGNISVNGDMTKTEDQNVALKGLWFRMNDKINRLRQLVLLSRENSLANEPVEDAYGDLSVYGIICLLVKSGKWKK